jgi:hypothetical protein
MFYTTVIFCLYLLCTSTFLDFLSTDIINNINAWSRLDIQQIKNKIIVEKFIFLLNKLEIALHIFY